jgi:hypothetical protein
VSSDAKTLETLMPARLDRLPWNGFPWLLVIGLGITWVLGAGSHPDGSNRCRIEEACLDLGETTFRVLEPIRRTTHMCHP